MSNPARYRIRVHGRMDPAWSDFLHGMTVTVIDAQDQPTVTELCGRLPDQAALMGVLQQLYNCLIPVISVECMNVNPCPGGAAASSVSQRPFQGTDET